MRQALSINYGSSGGWREYQGDEFRVFVRARPQLDTVYSQSPELYPHDPTSVETEWKWIDGHWVKEKIEKKIVAV